MAAVLRRIDRHWDWRLSAHFRIGSLASAWLLVLLMPVLGWLLVPLGVFRSAASLVQSALNIRLGRHVPVSRQDRWDWALLGAIFALAYVAAGISYTTGMPNYSLPLVLPLLVPFSALQLRMVTRSFAAHSAMAARPAAVLRLEDYRRGMLRPAGEVDRAA
jgi:hypothetical protein